VENQAEVEKSETGTHSSQQELGDIHAEDPPSKRPPSDTQPIPSKQSRKKSTREEYKQVMEAFYTAVNDPTGSSTTNAAYSIWRQQNPTGRPNLDANKLANARSDIIKTKRLTKLELDTIQEKVARTASGVSSAELNR